MKSIDEIRETFALDRFAAEAAGIVIEEAGQGCARCTMEIKPVHLNARGTVMGGAIFTLADFAVAVAANGLKDEPDTVTLHAGITFLTAAKGNTLIAEASCVKAGRTTGLYDVVITDELGTLVAKGEMNGFIVNK